MELTRFACEMIIRLTKKDDRKKIVWETESDRYLTNSINARYQLMLDIRYY